LILDKLAGFVEFSKGVMVVAAGNSPEESSVAHMISVPLAGRFKIMRISPTTVDKWYQWIKKKHGDQWDKSVYAFLKRFESEGYLLKLPRDNETLEQYGNPFSWERLGVDLYEGFDTLDDIIGWVGGELGQKFYAFRKVKVDIEDLIRKPELFNTLDLDGQYMAVTMLASWLTDKAKKKNAARQIAKSFPLIDQICEISRDLLVVCCMMLNKKTLTTFLRELFKWNKDYSELLDRIFLQLKKEITRSY